MKLIYRIARIIQNWNEVSAVTLSGSISHRMPDRHSDLDIIVYLDKDIGKEKRARELSRLNGCLEQGIRYGEDADCLILESSLNIDIIYRNAALIEDELRKMLTGNSKHKNTMLPGSIEHAEVLFDRIGHFRNLQSLTSGLYPEPLRQRILNEHSSLLGRGPLSISSQMGKALARKDLPAMISSLSQWTDSCLETVFALNRLYSTGRNHALRYLRMHAAFLPDSFMQDMDTLFEYALNLDRRLPRLMEKITDRLEMAIEKSDMTDTGNTESAA